MHSVLSPVVIFPCQIFEHDSCCLVSVPDRPPRNLAVRNVSSRSVVLEWDEPPQQHWNGDITEYIVSVSMLENTSLFIDGFSLLTLLRIDTGTVRTQCFAKVGIEPTAFGP